MKTCMAVLALLLVFAAGTLFLSSGFEKRTDVCLQDVSVSEDGSVMTVKTTLSGSMGYLRAMETETIGNAVHCSFYSTFGGLNSGVGSKNTFELPLDGSIEKIYFDRGTAPDMLVLERDGASNGWMRK